MMHSVHAHSSVDPVMVKQKSHRRGGAMVLDKNGGFSRASTEYMKTAATTYGWVSTSFTQNSSCTQSSTDLIQSYRSNLCYNYYSNPTTIQHSYILSCDPGSNLYIKTFYTGANCQVASGGSSSSMINYCYDLGVDGGEITTCTDDPTYPGAIGGWVAEAYYQDATSLTCDSPITYLDSSRNQMCVGDTTDGSSSKYDWPNVYLYSDLNCQNVVDTFTFSETCQSTTDYFYGNDMNYFYYSNDGTVPSSSSSSSSSSDGLSSGAIAGIVIGSVVGVVAIGVALWFFVFSKMASKPLASAAEEKNANPMVSVNNVA